MPRLREQGKTVASTLAAKGHNTIVVLVANQDGKAHVVVATKENDHTNVIPPNEAGVYVFRKNDEAPFDAERLLNEAL